MQNFLRDIGIIFLALQVNCEKVLNLWLIVHY
jgi:hypothetical protein